MFKKTNVLIHVLLIKKLQDHAKKTTQEENMHLSDYCNPKR
jgi:hypothetical protein